MVSAKVKFTFLFEGLFKTGGRNSCWSSERGSIVASLRRLQVIFFPCGEKKRGAADIHQGCVTGSHSFRCANERCCVPFLNNQMFGRFFGVSRFESQFRLRDTEFSVLWCS